MIVKQYIKDFENLGFGMYVHFGIYSVLGKGEWAKHLLQIPDEEYYGLMKQFDPKPDWAIQLVKTAKKGGCKYITLTTRHHDGFSLYDTHGLCELDAIHAKCGRDLVREFVDACRAEGIKPFFYHTYLDWYQKDYSENFPKYLEYLRKSVELLCTNYGKIGGIIFDGKWHKPDADWEEDAMYSLIRKHQPDAMIINNTGLNALGATGHIELDSVTFERGKPQPLNMEGAPKYLASEMSEVMNDHWGYAAEDLDYKSPASMIEELADCRRYGANLLMNLGPMGDGTVRTIDAAILEVIGTWIRYFEEAVREPRPADVCVQSTSNDFLLKKGNCYYLFCYKLPMLGDANVTAAVANDPESYTDYFELPETVRSITWMDNNTEVAFEQDGNKVTVHKVPYVYGRSLVVRVAKIEC